MDNKIGHFIIIRPRLYIRVLINALLHLMQNMLKLLHLAIKPSVLFFISGNLLSWYHDNRISHICLFAPTFFSYPQFYIHAIFMNMLIIICAKLSLPNFFVPLMHITLGQHTIQYIVDPNLSIIEYLYHRQITNLSISTTNVVPKMK